STAASVVVVVAVAAVCDAADCKAVSKAVGADVGVAASIVALAASFGSTAVGSGAAEPCAGALRAAARLGVGSAREAAWGSGARNWLGCERRACAPSAPFVPSSDAIDGSATPLLVCAEPMDVPPVPAEPVADG